MQIFHNLIHYGDRVIEPVHCERVSFVLGIIAFLTAVSSGLIEELTVAVCKDLVIDLLFRYSIAAELISANRTE